MKKGMLFIDGSNVYFDWKKENESKQLDISKYIEYIKTSNPDIDLIRTYYFVTKTDTNEDFIRSINRIPCVETVCGRLQNKTIQIDLAKCAVNCPSCSTNITTTVPYHTQTDKGTDVNIAVEMLKHAYRDSYDCCLLATRDADFCGVVQIAKYLGKNVKVVLFEGSKSDASELSETADEVFIIPTSDQSSLIR